jgi:hypothetical protein
VERTKFQVASLFISITQKYCGYNTIQIVLKKKLLQSIGIYPNIIVGVPLDPRVP